MEQREAQQWHLLVQVIHGPGFGHKITMQQKLRGHDAGPRETIGSWTGLEIPEQVMSQATAVVAAVVQEHLTMRYGAYGFQPVKWAGEPDPF